MEIRFDSNVPQNGPAVSPHPILYNIIIIFQSPSSCLHGNLSEGPRANQREVLVVQDFIYSYASGLQ